MMIQPAGEVCSLSDKPRLSDTYLKALVTIGKYSKLLLASQTFLVTSNGELLIFKIQKNKKYK